jgi:hypothetical protein
VTLTIFLAAISQHTISVAQGVVTQTGKETIESYDSVKEVLTISGEYSYQWPSGPTNRSFPIPKDKLIGAVSFSPKGANACNMASNGASIQCPGRFVTSFSMSYRYKMQINATEDGQEEFTYESGFARQAGYNNVTYDLLYPHSWIIRRDRFNKPSPEPKIDGPGHFQWELQNINAFTAKVRFRIRPPCPAGMVWNEASQECAACGWADLDELKQIAEARKGTQDELYARFWSCLNERACGEYVRTGESGIAGGFNRFMFDYMAAHPSQSALDVTCSDLAEDLGIDFDPGQVACFALTANFHFENELSPGFHAYCNEITPAQYNAWDVQHERFVTFVNLPCFDTIRDELDIYDDETLRVISKITTTLGANFLREQTQEDCRE